MVDSAEKGARAETLVKKTLIRYTGLNFQRVPSSGALNAAHGLKGDLYIPNEKNVYCIEVKHYKDDCLTSSILTGKNPLVIDFWEQTIREAEEINREPLLIFKFDRSKIFVAFLDFPTTDYRHLIVSAKGHLFYVATLEDWINNENPKFIL